MPAGEERLVVFKIRSRKPRGLTIADAKHVVDYLPEPQPNVVELRERIQHTAGQGGGDVVIHEDRHRAALVEALEAITDQGQLTGDERALLDVALEPIMTSEQ
jgi:hypothetical protein